MFAAYTLSPRAPLSWLDPGVFGTLGVGAGFALAAKCARPNTECWLIYGDGALGTHHLHVLNYVNLESVDLTLFVSPARLLRG